MDTDDKYRRTAVCAHRPRHVLYIMYRMEAAGRPWRRTQASMWVIMVLMTAVSLATSSSASRIVLGKMCISSVIGIIAVHVFHL